MEEDKILTWLIALYTVYLFKVTEHFLYIKKRYLLTY